MRKVPLLRPSVKRMSRASVPSALEVPLKTTLDQAYHFGMFTMKTVLDGRATELIELAKVNLTR
jgi:pyruvate dehydrogenase (quinone)